MVGCLKTRYQTKESGLSAAARPEDGHDVTLLQLQRKIFENGLASPLRIAALKGLGDALNLENQLI